MSVSYLNHNQREVLNLKPALTLEAQEKRIAAVCGSGFVDNAVKIDIAASGLHLHGWVGLPTFSRSQPDMQFFYVNGRLIKDRLVAHAVKQAYQDVLYHGRHPLFVLFLILDPALVDVNAHPTKLEVRFREGRTVHDFLFQALHRSLADLRPGQSPAFTARIDMAAVDSADGFAQTESASRQAVAPLHLQTSLPMSVFTENAGQPAVNKSGYRHPTDRSNPSQSVADQLKAYGKLYPPFPIADAVNPPQDKHSMPPLGFALAHIHNIYILAETADGIILVDAHAAHERVSYERLKQDYHSRAIISQPLLLPVKLKVSATEAALLNRSMRFFWIWVLS